MIPKIIHYCWFGRGEMLELALKCIESWHKYMPDWEYKLWNEDTYDIDCCQYSRQAYNARKYAFVSDVARLKALAEYGGVYMDTDVLVFKSLEPLLNHSAFAGFEGSKNNPIGTCVLASEKGGIWVRKQLEYYNNRDFIKEDGSLDLTTNVSFITSRMEQDGLKANGIEQDFMGLHIFPVDYFSPRQTTGDYKLTSNTFCDHLGMGSWAEKNSTWKTKVLSRMNPAARIYIIKIKRLIFG